MKSTRFLTLFLSLATLMGTVKSVAAAEVETPEQREARLKWFKEARFGMFIHWGVYAVPAGVWKDKPIRGIGEWILKNGSIPLKDYRAFAKDFTAAKYDPSAWADLAKQAGMKYVVITSKHHDGFTLYDSKVSDWNAVKASGAKRDLIAPLEKEVRARGLKFGLYYSQAQDWTHPGGAIMGKKAGEPGWDPAQTGDFDKYLKDIALPQTEEILATFKPDVIWWDTPSNMTTERGRPLHDALAAVPGIITNNRLGGDFKGDTSTPEQHIPPRGYPGEMFEVCMTMNDTWGYKKDDHNWKSVTRILQNLSDISSKGGNFLLNVGPTAEGEIPAESIERLKAVGQWMDSYSEAIYATEASPFARRLNWGRVTRKTVGDKTMLYLHVWDWPADGKLLLPTLKEKPISGKVMKTGASVTAESSAEGVVVTLPGKATDPNISVVALEFQGPLTITQQSSVGPGADGSIELDAFAADLHGGYTGTIRVEGSGKQAMLSDWKLAEWWVEYMVNTPAAKEWKISAEVAASDKVKLNIGVGKTKADVEVPATGGEDQWKTVSLGTIKLPKGESSLQVHPVKAGWKPIRVRKVTLTPVD
ncbi:MAG: alpha-L-fucosidase [Verrucomicrobiota bacterium]